MLALSLLTAVLVAAGADPRPGPLDDTGPPARSAEPARPLPRTVTVCVAVADRRCWTVGGESTCPGGEPFRTVIDAAGGSDVDRAMAECEQRLGASPR